VTNLFEDRFTAARTAAEIDRAVAEERALLSTTD
jgi:hypothetical protein